MNHHQQVREFFSTQRREHKTRHREIAEKLNMSEAELIAAHTDNTDVDSLLLATSLVPKWHAILSASQSFGEVMALTRNASCVHEIIGNYPHADDDGNDGFLRGQHIDLRSHYSKWAFGFAVAENTGQGVQHSLQFFDLTGTAIHKIFLRPQSKLSAYTALVNTFASHQHVVTDHSVAQGALIETNKDDDIQIDHAQCLSILLVVAQKLIPVSITVDNLGMSQTFKGTINKVVPMGPWINVLDSGFNLHLRTDQIASSRLTKQTSSAGTAVSIELFDQNLQKILQMSELRQAEEKRSDAWQNLLVKLEHGERGESLCAA
ncbi:ChuX/HutX family heme-like substrate-binding protein [Undibacterium sp. SXout11W]|uniref:ChuX/HutX family heme-like substrate-binding protein n=1 Tax=Undibacterium sp. SXout11W TaxID=3413050 RepID=UPI003BF161DB